MKKLLYDIELEPGDIGVTIRHGRYAHDLFEDDEKIQLYSIDSDCNEIIIGEAKILFDFIEVYKNVDETLLKHIKFPGTYEPDDLVTLIFYKRLKKGDALWEKLLVFLKTFFHLNQ